MKNKRFEYLDYKDVVKDNQTNKEYHTWYEDNLLDLLNSLSEENEELKQDLARTKVLLSSAEKNYSGLLKLVHGFDGDVE